MALTEKDLRKKIAEIEELEISQKKKRYRGYKKGFTRKYTRYR